MIELYKYHGAGNDFVMCDNIDGRIKLSHDQIATLCDRHTGIGSDGLILLESATGYDFKMNYYNSDGSSATMCGNGARCTVRFASDMGILPASGSQYHFLAGDGPHVGHIVSNDTTSSESVVSISMKDIDEYEAHKNGTFSVNTGTEHLVVFVKDLDTFDVVNEGRKLRYLSDFSPRGTNVNFVEPEVVKEGEGTSTTLHIRTYEKGVEDETLACGTGITASAIAYYLKNTVGVDSKTVFLAARTETPVSQKVIARGGTLSVQFKPDLTQVNLTGPVKFVFKTHI